MSTVTIPLSQGKHALIDACDLPLVSPFRWFAEERYPGNFYAVRREYDGEGRRRRIYLHRVIVGVRPEVRLDHRNGNTLDCTRDNLRPATTSQNLRNIRKHRDGETPYKGIDRHGSSTRWRAQIQVDGKRIKSRTFATPEEAADAYDALARIHHGEFARTNS